MFAPGSPFEITADPNKDKFNVRDITPPGGITMDRVDRRRKMLARIDQLQRETELQPDAFEVIDEHYETALNMITSPQTRQAFDIASENKKPQASPVPDAQHLVELCVEEVLAALERKKER